MLVLVLRWKCSVAIIEDGYRSYNISLDHLKFGVKVDKNNNEFNVIKL